MLRLRTTLILATFAMSLLAATLPVSAQPTITLCATGIGSSGMVINRHQRDAFFTKGGRVTHVSRVKPGDGPCSFGPLLPDILLGPGMEFSSGVALDRSGNLYVAGGPGDFSMTSIVRIAPPYTGTPEIFFSNGTNLRALAIRGDILYAADFAAGTILRFDLSDDPSSVTTFGNVPGVFGIFAAAVDDLFVTSNAGFTGIDYGVGTDDVKHVTKNGVSTVVTGLGFPEGIGGDDENLYTGSRGVVVIAPVTGGTPVFYAGSPILFGHYITVFRGAGYITESSPPGGHVFKFTLLDDDDDHDTGDLTI